MDTIEITHGDDRSSGVRRQASETAQKSHDRCAYGAAGEAATAKPHGKSGWPSANPLLRLEAQTSRSPAATRRRHRRAQGRQAFSANNHLRHIPKVQKFAEITLLGGIILREHVFIEATTRIQDLLNGPTDFFPFVDDSGHIRLLNKHAVTQVVPYDHPGA